jgi:hypothetical protein
LFGLPPSCQVSYDEVFGRVLLYEAARQYGIEMLEHFVGNGAAAFSRVYIHVASLHFKTILFPVDETDE